MKDQIVISCTCRNIEGCIIQDALGRVANSEEKPFRREAGRECKIVGLGFHAAGILSIAVTLK